MNGAKISNLYGGGINSYQERSVSQDLVPQNGQLLNNQNQGQNNHNVIKKMNTLNLNNTSKKFDLGSLENISPVGSGNLQEFK